MSNGSSATDSPLPPVYTVFLNPKQWGNADDYYKKFPSDGDRNVGTRPVHFAGDFLSLINTIVEGENPYVLLVTHAWENGLSMPLVQAKKHHKKGDAPASTSKTAISLLLLVAMLREGIQAIEQKPKDKQTVGDWQALNKRRKRFLEGWEKDPLEALQNAQRSELGDSKVELDPSELEGDSLEFQIAELKGKPGEHAKELKHLERKMSELDAKRKEEEEAEKSKLRKQITEWIDEQRSGALHITPKDLDDLLAGSAALRKMGLKDVQIRGCNLGNDTVTMRLLRLFFDSDTLVAPKVKTGYGPLPVHITKPPLQAHHVCKPKELITKSGCWWSYDRGAFQVRIVHSKKDPHHFQAEAESESSADKDSWVHEKLGKPRTKLGDVVPIHLLDTMPPVFPLDSEFEDNLESVSR